MSKDLCCEPKDCQGRGWCDGEDVGGTEVQCIPCEVGCEECISCGWQSEIEEEEECDCEQECPSCSCCTGIKGDTQWVTSALKKWKDIKKLVEDKDNDFKDEPTLNLRVGKKE